MKIFSSISKSTSMLPVHPILSWKSFLPCSLNRDNCILDISRGMSLTSGRIAMAIALKSMGAGPNVEVLLPAFHSTSMPAAVQWTGSKCSFYRIKPDLTPDWQDIKKRINKNTKIIIIVHYFGFPQPIESFLGFCKRNDLRILEDCAHAFFSQASGKPLGSFGDYAIASPMKFFPVFDGGYLLSTRYELERTEIKKNHLGFEIKSAFNILERSLYWSRLKPLPLILKLPLWLKSQLWQLLKRKSIASPTKTSSATEGGEDFDPFWINKPMSFASRCVMYSVSRSRIAHQRRKNFRLLLESTAIMPGCYPLFDSLPPGVVPYLFPLFLKDPESTLPVLRQSGIPILHFAEKLPASAIKTCSVSAKFSRHLIQLPCHQELTDDEMKKLVLSLRSALESNFS